jgi:nicotinate dehydrogenase subunit A
MNMHTTAPIAFYVNGQPVSLDIAGDAPLLNVLRNDLCLNGPKFGCGLGECGACTVLIDGVAARSCVIPLAGVARRAVITLDGLERDGTLDPVQQAFIDEQGAQCGYCMNGMIMTLKALLLRCPAPTEQQIRNELDFNLCRCGTHVEIMRCALRAVELTCGDVA